MKWRYATFQKKIIQIIMIVKMIQEHGGKKTEVKIEKVQEMFTTHLEELKNREEPNTGGNQ